MSPGCSGRQTPPVSADEQVDEQTFDVIVLGAGAVGENVAGRVAAGGLSCALVESELVGGECSYWACMPSKALLHPTQAVAAAKRLQGASAAVTGEVDVQAVLDRRTSFTHGWDDSSQVEWVDGAGIDLVRGVARVSGEREVTVVADDGDRVLRARTAVVVCTGSEPVTPPVPGLDGVDAWHSREATSAGAVPASLVVLGAGVVGVELAQAYARLGSRVTVLALDRVFAGAERRAGELVAEALREDGVDLRLGAEVTRVEADGGDGAVVVTLADDAEVRADRLLVATGRRPRTADLGLEAFGVTAGRAVEVDDSGLARGSDWLYAAGDVTGRAPLTHQGKYAARAVGSAILARHRGDLGAHEAPADWSAEAATADHAAVPQVVFTDPQVAWVGPTRERAERDHPRLRVVEYDVAQVAGASVTDDHYRGWAQLLVDEERRVVVGATFVGPDVAELLHSATVAVVGEVPVDRLWHAVPSYPTTSEVWLRLLETYGL
ncbi:NAD(P)/FAD-dependent oxidoreductase [Angustibacter speluncae]